MGVELQKEMLRSVGFTDADFEQRVETDNDKQPALKTLIKQIRESTDDEIWVAYLHRFCSNSKGMAKAIEDITDKNAVVCEVGGARSDKVGKFVDAYQDSVAVLAGRMTRADLRKRALAGAEASPVTKYATGGMPDHMMEAILNDRGLTITAAIAKIHADRRYKRKYSRATILRWMAKGKLKVTNRPAGKKKPKPVSIETTH